MHGLLFDQNLPSQTHIILLAVTNNSALFFFLGGRYLLILPASNNSLQVILIDPPLRRYGQPGPNHSTAKNCQMKVVMHMSFNHTGTNNAAGVINFANAPQFASVPLQFKFCRHPGGSTISGITIS